MPKLCVSCSKREAGEKATNKAMMSMGRCEFPDCGSIGIVVSVAEKIEVKHVKISIDEFDAKFPTIKNKFNKKASLDGCMFETYGKELEFVKKQKPLCIWTYMDDDNGNPCFCSGFHVVNRIGYMVSKVPFEDNISYYVEL